MPRQRPAAQPAPPNIALTPELRASPVLLMVHITLLKAGQQAHQASGPGLAAFITSLIDSPDNARAIKVFDTLCRLLTPSFHPASGPGVHSLGSAAAVVSTITLEFVRSGILRAAAALAASAPANPLRPDAQEAAMIMVTHLGDEARNTVGVLGLPELRAFVTSEPLLAACVQRLLGAPTAATPKWLAMMARAVVVLQEGVPLRDMVSLTNCLLDCLVKRGSDLVATYEIGNCAVMPRGAEKYAIAECAPALPAPLCRLWTQRSVIAAFGL